MILAIFFFYYLLFFFLNLAIPCLLLYFDSGLNFHSITLVFFFFFFFEILYNTS